jgi:hypothetical protein
MSNQANTKDLGLALRYFLQGESFPCYREGPDVKGELHESEEIREIEFVDVSDANNPVVQLDNGQKFTIRIFAHG